MVGAGPGRADLITVRGADLIRRADCIICDKLANPALLKMARPDAEIIHVPKRIGSGSFTQDRINELLLEKAQDYRLIVRLKGGDPCVFGRCAEEAIVLADAGIDFEIVPGITAGIAAADYTGILLTDRRHSSQVVFITGRETEGKQDTNIDWDVLARFPGTIVFYMGVGTLAAIVEQLLAHGRSGRTPAAVIANATLPDQRVTKAPLEAIQDKCAQDGIEPPAIIVIGAAADSDPRLDWFARLPLFGKTIVMTRDQRGNAEFAAKILACGGNPIPFPTIKIEPRTQSRDFIAALGRLSHYDWIVFTSANGVRVFFDALSDLGKDARVFGRAAVAAIGTPTADALNRMGIRPDFVPTVFTGAQLARQLAAYANLRGKSVLLLRSDIASDELADALRSAEAKVEDVAVYTTVPQQPDAGALKERIAAGQIDWITFASPSAADSFCDQVPAELLSAGNVKTASIGPVTTQRLEQLGVRVDAKAEDHTIDGLLLAIEQAPR